MPEPSAAADGGGEVAAGPPVTHRAPFGDLDPLERVGLVLFALLLVGLVFVVPVVSDIFAAQRQRAAAKAATAKPPAQAAPATVRPAHP